jgi:carboxyvinyl-carboxyphosphonate phosphorylmutase
MSRAPRRERFRNILAGSACIHPGSVFDPISARIAEELGFECGMLAGSVAALAVLGAPDLILLTLTEFAALARRICRAGELPLLVDADHGYGNALNVMRTVEELEAAGVAGFTIEDTLLPRPFGVAGPGLVSVEEGVGKMRAALSARQDPALAVIGRTSALQIAGIEAAVERGIAYERAGVDALFFVGVKTWAQLDALAEAVTVPIILGGVPAELMDREALAARRVRICLQGHQPVMAAIAAAYEALKALRAGTAPRSLAGIAPPDLVKRLSHDADYARWTKDFLGG